jgi:transposase
MIMATKATIIELDMDKLEEILQRVEAKELQADDYATIRMVIESYVGLFNLVGDKATTISRLRKMLFGAKTEKTAAVVGDGGKNSQSPPPPPAGTDPTTATPKDNVETGLIPKRVTRRWLVGTVFLGVFVRAATRTRSPSSRSGREHATAN